MSKNIEKLLNTGLFNIKPGLERIQKVLDLINSPHKNRKYVIIGGTNGKGSVCTYLANILQNNGYKTGLYTSPHLVSVTERIKIDGKEISKADLDMFLGIIFKVCEENNIVLSYFELITATAFIYFDKNEIDIGVLEVGMGGRWDATNVIEPLISVITNVSLDHVKYLGNTIGKIAAEKAEIIKKNGIAVTSAQREALRLIRNKSAEKSAKLFFFGKDFNLRSDKKKDFHYVGTYLKIKCLDLKFKPSYQIKNIALSICCAEILINKFKYKIEPEKIKKVIADTFFNGRFEFLKKDPPLILDGSHNVDAAKKLVVSLSRLYPDTKFTFMISMLKTKNIKGFVEQIIKISKSILITEIPGKESHKAEQIEKIVMLKTHDYKIIRNPKKAFKELVSYNGPGCICGSLYLIGYLKKEVLDEKTWNS